MLVLPIKFSYIISLFVLLIFFFLLSHRSHFLASFLDHIYIYIYIVIYLDDFLSNSTIINALLLQYNYKLLHCLLTHDNYNSRSFPTIFLANLLKFRNFVWLHLAWFFFHDHWFICCKLG